MPELPFSENRARFRDDLVYHPGEDGFDLVSPNQVHHFKGQQVYGSLGPLIAAGRHTYQELHDVMTSEHQVNLMVTVSVVQKLFDEGFLDERNPDDSNMP